MPAPETRTTTLTADDLLLGGTTTHRVVVPGRLLGEAETVADVTSTPTDRVVVLRPLVLADVSRIDKAARDDETLTSVLMVSQSLVEPAMTIDQVQQLPAGLVEFLLREVNRISGLSMTGEQLADAVQAPLARACFVLGREFGWTPDECAGLTVGQVLLYLELLGRGEPVAATVP